MSPRSPSASPTRVNLVTLGCARNEVDSSEIAGRLQVGGYELVADPAGADVVVVNTCAFVASAKKDSIDTVLAAADTGAKVVAVGCLAERYGAELAQALPEADAVLGFDAYPDLAALLGDVVDGHRPAAHTPVDRRLLLPISPAARPSAAAEVSLPGHAPASGPTLLRTLLHSGPVAPLKIASGCDRRCTFCAIPSFRGAFVSRPIDEIVAEAHWLAGQGVREIVLVSENSTSFGKDLPGERQLEDLLGALAAVPGILRVRLVLPAAGGDPALADRGHRQHSRRRRLLRHVVPARLRARAAADATVRFAAVVPEPGRADPRRVARKPASGPTSSSASPGRPKRISPNSRRS